ncbi:MULTISPECIES: hypothetical protein [Aneurinibacillus]|jgi:hypothetical protein|uniref:Uncharacterized protein n=1 Tax=Aneurinibacillus thermoaerophilus TaxID=143495 RepID=A0A1G8CF94_ANETH|nr:MULTISPECIES: hypothetical protein [Aneurinibacillus]MED0674155.1 hypothetical protein [Aneurinibacillus thermoaerophilus]MED0680447.1 hypothetical protein [Aneurinibacillus thermoaerophilus]MED0737296.1 hypothetical protein [Aneurinibacillus thermoaerophilus]MED0758625.1 hypothetical protein [Aneurinibacillus thermoaerophilus]MED0761894.1 hypothetical protein [Aneurinibacillus thermoaerophilus]
MSRVDRIERKVSARTSISLSLFFCSLVLSLVSFFSSFTSYIKLLVILQWLTTLTGLTLAATTVRPAKKHLAHNSFFLQLSITTIMLGCFDLLWISFMSYILSILR